MDSALLVHRLHFAFTITFHYLFPQLTMGLALLIVVLKTMALRSQDENRRNSTIRRRASGRTFSASTSYLGVVTGIPMEFQFGTNWSSFSRFAGGVIGQTLAMEGMFAFFLESSFLGLFLYGEKRLSPRAHWWSAVAVFLGSWLSGYFIIATDAFMQYPVGYATMRRWQPSAHQLLGSRSQSVGFWQYAHNMSGAAITGGFVMTAVGAFYLLARKCVEHGRIFVKIGVIVGCVFSILQLFPTGDDQGRTGHRHQPVTLAAMEGLFQPDRRSARPPRPAQ